MNTSLQETTVWIHITRYMLLLLSENAGMNEWVKTRGLQNNEENKMKGRQLLTKDFIIVSKISGILGHSPKYFCHCFISHVCFVPSLHPLLTFCYLHICGSKAYCLQIVFLVQGIDH